MLTSFNYQGILLFKAHLTLGTLSSYVEDTAEDPSNLRSNPPEEGEVDAGACPQGYSEDDQGQRDQEQGALTNQIQALFSFPSSHICTVLDNHFGDDPMVMIG